MFIWWTIQLFLYYLSMFLNGPIYKDVLRIVSQNNLIYEKSIFKLWEKYLFIYQLCVYRDMKHLDNLEWIQEERLLFSVTPRVTLTHVSYPPNFLYVAYLTETRGGAEHNYAEEARCSRWFTVRGPLNITFGILFLYFSTIASWSVVRLHGAQIAMFSVISNVSIFICLVFFIRKAGRYTRSSLLSERFPWRVKQLRAGLSGYIAKLVKGSVPCT